MGSRARGGVGEGGAACRRPVPRKKQHYTPTAIVNKRQLSHKRTTCIKEMCETRGFSHLQHELTTCIVRLHVHNLLDKTKKKRMNKPALFNCFIAIITRVPQRFFCYPFKTTPQKNCLEFEVTHFCSGKEVITPQELQNKIGTYFKLGGGTFFQGLL